MTNACGTGSPPSPAARASAGDDPEQQKHTAADQVEGEDLAQRFGMHDQAEQAQANQRRAAQAHTGSPRSLPLAPVRAGRPPTERALRRSTASPALRSSRSAAWHEIRGRPGKPPAIANPISPIAKNTAGPATSMSRNQRRLTGRRVHQPGHHGEDPHGGKDRCTLEFAAGSNRPNPEDVDADQDPDRHQQLGDKGQHALRISMMARTGQAAPERGPAPATRYRPAQAAAPPSPARCRSHGTPSGRR